MTTLCDFIISFNLNFPKKKYKNLIKLFAESLNDFFQLTSVQSARLFETPKH